MITLAADCCTNCGYCGSHTFPGLALLWQLPLAALALGLVIWGVSAFKRMAAEEKADAIRRRREHQQHGRGDW